MKKKLIALLTAALLLAGCGDTETSGSTRISASSNGVQAVLEQEMAKEDKGKADTAGNETASSVGAQETAGKSDGTVENLENTSENTGTGTDNTEKKNGAGLPEGEGKQASDVDVDLTQLSSTMVYTEVYNMVYSPEEYIGRKVRMEGPFVAMQDDATGMLYFACIIQDATACCSQGLEFVLDGEYSYPEDYPEQGTEITVVGEFDTYMEGEYRYCTLRHATIEKVGEPVLQ